MSALPCAVPLVRSQPQRTIAVALHGIEPQTFERCALIRDWLDDHGIERATLLVTPARDLHPVGERSPAMVDWLAERRHLGDSIAQHGFQNNGAPVQGSARRVLARAQLQEGAEFVGLDARETRSAVHAGWRVMKLAGIAPDGFVAPAYAYTDALRAALGQRFQWWAGLLRVHSPSPPGTRRARGPLAPAWSLAAPGCVNSALAPSLVRLGAALPTSTLRLDIHPAYLQSTRHMLALEWVLSRAGGRRAAVTYRDLAGA
jgi:hypothetical protein